MLPAACLAAQRSRLAIAALHGLQLFWDVVRTVRNFRSTTTKVPSDRAGKRGRGQSWTPRWRGRDDVAEMRILPPPPRSLRSAGSHRWRATPPRSVGGESAASRDGHRWPGRRPSCCAGPFNAGIAGTGFTACGRHHQHLAIGGEFQHRLAVLGTQQGKLHGREWLVRLQLGWQRCSSVQAVDVLQGRADRRMASARRSIAIRQEILDLPDSQAKRLPWRVACLR